MITLLLLVLLLPAPLLAAEFAVVQCALPTSNGGTVDCTSSGFGTPLGALGWGGHGTVNGTAVDHGAFRIGGYDGTRQNSIAVASEDAQADSDTDSLTDSNSFIATLLSTTQAQDGDCTAAFITDGIRITCADAPPSAYLMNILLVGGSGISNVYVGTGTGNGTSGGTTAISAPGFTPDVVIVWSANNDTINLHPSIGFATNEGSIVQRAMSIRDDDAAASMNVAARLSDTRIVTNPIAGATLELTSFDANGFTVTTRDASTAIPFGYMAINTDGLSVKLMTSAAPAGTGSAAVTGVGFEPQVGLMLQGEFTAVNTDYSTDNGEVFALSAFTSSTSASSAIYLEDSDGTSNTESITDSKVCATRKDAAAYAVCTFTSFDADGATLNYTTNVGGAKQRVLLFVETNTPAGSGFIPRTRRMP